MVKGVNGKQPPSFPSNRLFSCIFSCDKALFRVQPTLLMSAHAALGDGHSQNGYRFRDAILLAISACCRLQDPVSEYIIPFLHLTLYS